MLAAMVPNAGSFKGSFPPKFIRLFYVSVKRRLTDLKVCVEEPSRKRWIHPLLLYELRGHIY